MAWHIVIPARYESTRLPGKPLADIAGVPMILRVAQQAQATQADSVTVATDDVRIVDVVQAAGVDAVMTRRDHTSGSERVFEVAQQRGWDERDLLVNVQGDEPLIPPAVITQIAQAFADDPQREVVTLAEPIERVADVFDPHQVKVVFDAQRRAQYFSRAPIPWQRDGFDFAKAADDTALAGDLWWRHIGIYGYTVNALARYLSLPPSPYEALESLEQLRFLQHGIAVHVFAACATVPPGIDTPEDLANVNALLAESS